MSKLRGKKANFVIIDDLLNEEKKATVNRLYSMCFSGEDLERRVSKSLKDSMQRTDDMLDALKYSTGRLTNNWKLTNNYRELDLSFLSYNLTLGEDTMNEKKALAHRLLHRKLREAEIHVKDHSTMDTISCGSAREAAGYWIPVKLFVPQAELVSDKEYERVAYETASTMDIGTLLDYVTNSLIDIYKDDHKRFEEDKEDLEEDHDN